VDWSAAPFRPFCSERCRLIDFGAWVAEQRSIPADTASGESSTTLPEDGTQREDGRAE
jgi:endogenous inhibitor of DNA gyrase (YacG/DUF329 family)